MATSYFVQKHENELTKGIFCDLEKEKENLKINVRMREDRFEAQWDGQNGKRGKKKKSSIFE
jgi:hypothetical protein